MALYCKDCGNKAMLMSGTIYLMPDAEPYDSGVEEQSKTGIIDIDKRINAYYCEYCDKIIETFNEHEAD